jgi:glycosyltransferase involved in cell wall biosynthesis
MGDEDGYAGYARYKRVIRSVHIDTAQTWRGGQNQVLLTVTGLEELGHPAVLVAHESGELKRRAREGLRFVGFSPKSEFDVHAAWQLGRVLTEIRPDVVHAHDPMGVALAAMSITMTKIEPRPLLVAARRVDFHLKRHAFSKWKYKKIDLFIAASRVIADMLVEDGIPRDHIVVVHDGVNLGAIDKTAAVDAHAAFWLPHGAPVVGNVAALVGHKGQKHLVAAAALVVRELPDVRFLILGEGELRPQLERQVHDLGLTRHVLLPGFRGDAIAVQKSFDIFAMSSVTEGLGSAMLDAMACGTPVVATRAGGIPEAIVDGEHGLLVPPHDAPALAQAIVRLLRDDALRTRLAAAGRQRVVDEFSVERMVQKTVDAYSQGLTSQKFEARS